MSWEDKCPAPTIAARTLWEMPEQEFNKWRREVDYPRIISYLKESLKLFSEWMTDQKISDENLIEFSPSSFLRDESVLFLYKVIDKDGKEKQILRPDKHEINAVIFPKNSVQERKSILPYPYWYFKKEGKNSPTVRVNAQVGRRHFVLHDLELLDLGNYHLAGKLSLGDRLLDFTNICNLRITHCLNSSTWKLWFCAAEGLTIHGDFHFVDAYTTNFAGFINPKQNDLKLTDGRFQSWTFNDCQLNLTTTNATIHLWKFTGSDFEATISNTDIKDCSFKNSEVRYPIDYGRYKLFHAHVKRLYSQIGKIKEASEHFYLEKKYERKSLWSHKANYSQQLNFAKRERKKNMLRLRLYAQYVKSGFLNVLWGYGERVERIFGISIVTIILFACIYCFSPKAAEETHHNIANSVYYSIVTFSTLGYGDISQSTGGLRLVSGIEALLGMSFWGILIAGFTSKAKDY